VSFKEDWTVEDFTIHFIKV